MLNSKSVVLKLPLSDKARLAPFVEQCLAEGVSLIAVWGKGAGAVEDAIDDLIVGDGSGPERFLTTSAHEPGEDAVEFALAWDGADTALVVRL